MADSTASPTARNRGNAECDHPPRHGPRHERLAELRRQLAELCAKGRQTAPGSPERDAVLEEWAPVHAAALAPAEELEGEE